MDVPSREEALSFAAGQEIKSYKLVPAPSQSGTEANLVPLGSGGSGLVFLATQVLHEAVAIQRVLKFFMYRRELLEQSGHKVSGPVSSEEFLAEVQNLSELRHKNLLAVIDAGLYESMGLEIPFIVTDYVEGHSLADLMKEEGNEAEQEQAQALRVAIERSPSLVLEIILGILAGLIALEDAGFAHCDIAPKNVFLSAGPDWNVVVGDLGLAKQLSRERSTVFVAGTRGYMPEASARHWGQEIPWNEFAELQPQWDLYSLACTCLEFLEAYGPGEDQPWAGPLRATLEECRRGHYASFARLRERIQFLLPVQREVAAVPELSENAAQTRRLLIPVDGAVSTDRLRRIRKHPVLLRLAQVPQITMAYQVFPGAQHTRYEHSLGVLEAMRRYVLALLDEPTFLEQFRSRDGIELALLAGLLSNLTRFPFSNLIHEVKDRYGEALDPFSRASLLEELEVVTDSRGRTLLDLIDAYFPGVSQERLRNVLLGEKSAFTGEDQLIHSMLNCSLDARVVDFVRRDALHLGITNSAAFDLSEVVPHLTVRHRRLALRTTGLPIAEQVLSLRYWLFNRIYWNRPNRSVVAMVRHLIMQLSEQREDFLVRFRQIVLTSSQDEVLVFLNGEADNSGDSRLIDIARLVLPVEQRPFPVIWDASEAEVPEVVPVCARLATYDYRQLSDLEDRLQQALQKTLGASADGRRAFLIDLPVERRGLKLGEDIIVVRGDGRKDTLLNVSGIARGCNESFKKHLQRLRVFMHPELFPERSQRAQLQETIPSFLMTYVV